MATTEEESSVEWSSCKDPREKNKSEAKAEARQMGGFAGVGKENVGDGLLDEDEDRLSLSHKLEERERPKSLHA